MPKKPVPRPEDEESHLKKLREELEMSQEDLARELGVSSQTISRWELGKNVPTFTVKQMKALEKLLASIGRSIGDLPDNLRSKPLNKPTDKSVAHFFKSKI
ncbi:helix-turn-helix transcriptional regulator [Microcoleus sp. Pol7_A1]|uniref:helix-turn-helix transcriptional regulator n=1 Tax=Microcoleus sp. Pol7_A1 TaxID=2818893 RepID=UPI002FCF2C8E